MQCDHGRAITILLDMKAEGARSLGSDKRIERFCSFAALGCTEAFQAIFVCRSCCGSEQLCVCAACADQCHADHDVEYIGTGPCYCDCRDMGCSIGEQSDAEAARLGISAPASDCLSVEEHSIDKSAYIRDGFRIPLLENTVTLSRLALQALELVKHSRDTFWLEAGADLESDKSVCELELLAWRIFRQHMQHYGLKETENCRVGAEWWVQVKPVTLPPLVNNTEHSRLESYANGAESVDLHYDKDESMAESFGLGFFPTLSTVTYLSDSWQAPPTLVFSCRYDQGDNVEISEMLISHPTAAKHVVFDGLLLHGAPSHYALRPLFDSRQTTPSDVDWGTGDNTPRITFLVNIWTHHKPAGVEVLPNAIREVIQTAAEKMSGLDLSFRMQLDGAEEFMVLSPLAQIDLTDVDDLPIELRGKIELPFVGGKATWCDDNEDNEGAMVLVTYPPPLHQDDTLLVRFGSNLKPFLHYSGCDDDDDSAMLTV